MQQLLDTLQVWPKLEGKHTFNFSKDIKNIDKAGLFQYEVDGTSDRRFTENRQKNVTKQDIYVNLDPPYWNTYQSLVTYAKKTPQQKDMQATTYDINSTILMPWIFARMVAMKDNRLNYELCLPDEYVKQMKYLIKYHGTIGSTLDLTIADVAKTTRYGLAFNSQKSLFTPQYYHIMATLFVVYAMNSVLCFERDFSAIQDAMTTIKETDTPHTNHNKMMEIWCKFVLPQ
jgi:hypothetical protein